MPFCSRRRCQNTGPDGPPWARRRGCCHGSQRPCKGGLIGIVVRAYRKRKAERTQKQQQQQGSFYTQGNVVAPEAVLSEKIGKGMEEEDDDFFQYGDDDRSRLIKKEEEEDEYEHDEVEMPPPTYDVASSDGKFGSADKMNK